MARNHWIPIGHSSVEIKQTRRSLDAQGLVTIEIQKNRNAQCGAFQTKYWISLRFSRYRSHSHCTYLNKHFYAFLRARASPFDARIVFVCTFHARMSYHIVVATLSPQSTIQTKKKPASERAHCAIATEHSRFFPSTFFNFYKSATSLLLAHKNAFPPLHTYITWHFSHWVQPQTMWLKQSHAKTKDLSDEPALMLYSGSFRHWNAITRIVHCLMIMVHTPFNSPITLTNLPTKYDRFDKCVTTALLSQTLCNH